MWRRNRALYCSIVRIGIICFKNQIVHFIAPATGHDIAYQEKLWHLTSIQLEIMSPLIIISGLLGILCGVANLYGGYFWPSFSPVLPSVANVDAKIFIKKLPDSFALSFIFASVAIVAE